MGVTVSVVLAQAPSTPESSSQVTITKPDGTVEVTKPDGTVEVTTPDGTVEVTAPDGTVEVTAPDGTVEVTTPDGEITTTTPEGNVTTTRAPSPSPSSSGGSSALSTSATFSAVVTGTVISFEGTAAGDITVSLSGTMATYSRGGVSAPSVDIDLLGTTRLASGQTLDLTATQFQGPSLALRVIDGPGNVIIRDLHLKPTSNFTWVTNTGTKNATWNGSATATRGSYGSFTVSVASGSTLTQSASTLANTAIVGEGNVSITDLHLYPSLDLRSISNSGAQNAYWNGSSGSFTGHLGSFTTTVGTGSRMGISAERATNKNIVGIGSARVSIGGIRQAPDSNFSQISAKVSIDSNSGGPSTFTGNLGSLRSLSHYTRLSGSVNGDKIAFASSSGPQPDGLSVTENGQWHWNSTNDILTYCVNGVTYRLEIFGAEEVTHSDNFFTISR